MNEGISTGGIATIVLPERVDSATSESVERLLLDALRPGAPMIIDGHAVSYMSAAGVRALATVLHHAAEVEAHVAFCRFGGAAADCLLVSGFTQLFDVVESLEEARDKLKTKQAQSPAERLHPRLTTG
jgi:anti-sigma B factor antagonist